MRTGLFEIVVSGQVIATATAATVLEPVWWSANIYGTLQEYERSLSRFTNEQRLMLALKWYVSEVSNGGHDQFYFNSTGIVWPDAVAAFESLDLTEGAQILRESARRLGGNPSRERSERQRQLEEADADFGDLDERFDQFQDKVDLEAAMVGFIRTHADRFRFAGTIERPIP